MDGQSYFRAEIQIAGSWVLCQSAPMQMPEPATEEWWEWADQLTFAELDPFAIRNHNYKLPPKAALSKLLKGLISGTEEHKDAKEAIKHSLATDASWAVWHLINKQNKQKQQDGTK